MALTYFIPEYGDFVFAVVRVRNGGSGRINYSGHFKPTVLEVK